MRFLEQYLFHIVRLRPFRGITFTHRTGCEGAGSQANCIMNAMTFARACGLPYVHTPLTMIAHADRPMCEWVTAWETFFNLGLGEVAYDAETLGVVNYTPEVYREIELCLGWRGRGDQLADCFKALIPELRRKYYSNKSPRTTEEVMVALHMRRGDVTVQNNSNMFTSTQKAMHTVNAVKSVLDSQQIPHTIRVYSQGNIEEFAELTSLGVEFFLDADPIWTLQELIEADVLIMAKSSFSSYAGIISSGIKIYEPADWSELAASVEFILNDPLDDWLRCEVDGTVDEVALEHQLLIRTKAKLNF